MTFGLALIVPVALVIGLSLWSIANTESARIEALALQSARAIAVDVDRQINAFSQSLQVIAASDALRRVDLDAFQNELDSVAVRTGQMVSLGRRGEPPFMVGGSKIRGVRRPPDAGEIVALRLAISNGQTATHAAPKVSDLIHDPDLDANVVSLEMEPWLAGGAAANFVLRIKVPVSIFQGILTETETGNDLTSIVDRSDRIVARSIEPERFVGQTASDDLRLNAQGSEGRWLGATKDGRPVLAVYARAAQSGWRVAIGINRQEMSMPFRQSLFQFLAITALLLVVAIALALMIGRRLTSAVKRLTHSATTSASGGSSAPLVTPIKEINEIGAELAETSFNLSEHANALFANEARLKAIYETDPVGIVVAEAPSGRIVEGNHAASNILRYPVIACETVDDYHQWIAFHADGSRVESHEYPMYRVLRNNEERPELECQALRGDGTKAWIRIIGAPIRDSAGTMTGALVAIVDIDDMKRAQDDHRLMNRELHHRVKNTLATVLAITNLTTRSASDIVSFRKTFADRIMSLSRTHTLLIENSWLEIPLRALIEGELDPYINHESPQVTIDGEDIALPSDTALALGMAFHELTTNAVKYGSLSRPAGRLAIAWHVLEPHEEGEKSTLSLSWVEVGGPEVSLPSSRGFGSQLLQQILARQLKGEVKMLFERDGLKVFITVPR
ncbi:MAG: PAS domain S-box protein [Beijerinckiaceae bacterium]|nr:PAS domain S-box protein [Beijerinckiaceae bacterium]